MTVAENIKRLRKEKSMTQKQLGAACGMAESTLRQYELGLRNPKIDTIRKISNGLSVSMSELLEGCWDEYKSEIQEDFGKSVRNLSFSMSNMSEQIKETVKNAGETAERKAQETLNSDFRSVFLLNYFSELNSIGRSEACKRVRELTELEKYTDPEEDNKTP